MYPFSMTRMFAVAVCLAGTLLLHPTAIPMTDDLRRLLAFVGQMTVALVCVRETGKRAVLMMPVAWLVAASHVPDELAVTIWTLCAASCLVGVDAVRAALMTVACAEGALVVWGLDRPLMSAVADWTVGLLGLDVGRGLGSTYLFTRPLCYLALTNIVWAVWQGGISRVCGVAALVIGTAALVAWRAAHACASLDTMPDWWAGGLAIVLVAFPILVARKSVAQVGPTSPVMGVVAAVGLGWCASWLWPAHVQSPRPPRVVFLNEGGLDWDVPVWGKYRGFSGGMFGVWPHALARAGFDTRALSWQDTLAQLDGDCDVVVTINNPRIVSPEERGRLESWLEKGGALLVLGDHTNVFGLQTGFNSFLEPWGCSLRFDSAYAVDGQWWRRTAVRRPMTMERLSGEFLAYHAVGASLRVDRKWHRLLEGVFGFSDDGEPYNVPGSYLGNYKFDKSEPLGNLTLAAWRPMGGGIVVAYGDTSAFQNGSLERTFLNHILPLFRWMSGRNASESMSRDTLGVLLCLVVIAGAAGARARRTGLRPTVPLVVVAVVTVGGRAVQTEYALLATLDLHDAILVDNYSLPYTGHYEAHWNSIGALSSNAQRCGYWTLGVKERFSISDADPAALVLVGPQRPVDPARVDDLERYTHAGGTVIVACGHEDAAGVAGYLRVIGAAVGDVPLGRVHDPDQEDRTAPQFWDAWPLVLPAAHTVVARAGDQCVMAHVPRGLGGCLLVGDTRFFSTQNLEDMDFVHVGNTTLVNQAIQKFIRPTRIRLAPIADNPIKPD